MTKSLQRCREVLVENRQHLLAYDSETFTNLEGRLGRLKDTQAHAADFRRLGNEAQQWSASFLAREGWDTRRDGPILDAMSAFVDIVNIEIQNRTIAGSFASGHHAPSTKWLNAETGKAVRVYERRHNLADDHAGQGGITLGDVIAAKFLGVGDRPEVKSAVQEGTDSAGGYTVPSRILPAFIDRLRAKSQFINAGAKTLMLEGGKTRIVRIESDPPAAWRAESANISTGDPSFSVLEFNPKSLAVLVKASREVLMDSVNVSDAVERAMVGAMALALDQACFFGDGTANSPLGLANTTGIQTVSLGVNGGMPNTYDDLLTMLYKLETANADNPTALIWNPRTADSYRKMKDGQGRYMSPPDDLRELPKLATTSVPINQTVGTSTDCSTVLMGNFKGAILGMREFLNITPLTQRYAETGEIAFVAHLRADVGFEHAAEFCALTGVRHGA